MQRPSRLLALLVASRIAARAFGFLSVRSSRPASVLHSVPNALDTLSSGLASICRLPKGITVNTDAANNNKSIQLVRLYDVENSRDCRAIRELITELDLVVDCVVPAAPNAKAVTDSSDKYALPSGASVPCLVVSQGSNDAITTLSGSDAISSFFKTELGLTEPVKADTQEQVIAALNQAGSYVAGLFRIGRGSRVSPAALSERPKGYQPLVLYSYEGNQFCRLVREVLAELDLPYELRNAGKQSPRRTELAGITGGSTQCPFLIDPNTKTQLSESADIIRYLYQQYAQWTPPSELLQWVSQTILPLAKPVFALLAPAQAGAWGEDSDAYQQEIAQAIAEIETAAKASPMVVYTYCLSPFSSECKALLDNLKIEYTEISLGQEWIPGLIRPGGSATRAALLEMTGQSSLPHIFIGGKSIGGLFSGTPGLLPALEAGTLRKMVEEANSVSVLS